MTCNKSRDPLWGPILIVYFKSLRHWSPWATCLFVCVCWAPAADATIFHRDVEIVDGFVTIRAGIESQVHAQRAWDVLTDFEHLERYFPSLDSSQVVARRDSSWTVQQVFTTRLILPWTFRTLLTYSDDPEQRHLQFHQLSGSLHDYSGSWTLSPENQGHSVRLEYRARARLRQSIPAFVLRYIVARHVEQTLAALVRELERGAPIARGASPHSGVPQ